jgi:ABC-type nitrate/sulfonate/bicarbonate transport system substrate-binding protein
MDADAQHMADDLVVGVISNSYGTWPLHIAGEFEFFKEYELDVLVRVTPSSTEHLRLLEQGQLNIGHQAADHIIRAVQHGSDLRVILGVNRPALSLIGPLSVTNIPALRLKKLGVDSPSTGFALLLKEILKQNSVSDHDYSLVAVGSSQKRFEALLSGLVDATLLDPPYDLKALELGYRRLGRTIDFFPNYQGSVLAARMSWAKQNSVPLIRFIQAYLRALNWLKQSRNRVAASGCLASALQINIETAEEIYDGYVVKEWVFCDSGMVNSDALGEVMRLMPEASGERILAVEPFYLNEAIRRLASH